MFRVTCDTSRVRRIPNLTDQLSRALLSTGVADVLVPYTGDVHALTWRAFQLSECCQFCCLIPGSAQFCYDSVQVLVPISRPSCNEIYELIYEAIIGEK